VDIWHGLDDTIVRWKQADILADAIPGAQRHFIADQGHFSMVFIEAASYLEPFRDRA
jgi:pimeloyl-ACP methyl ester carboxylesterase